MSYIKNTAQNICCLGKKVTFVICMHFFQSVNEVLSKNKVMAFPEVGIQFLKEKVPKEKNLAEFHLHLTDFILQLIPTQSDVIVRQHIVDTLTERIKLIFNPNPGNMQQIIILPSGSCMNGTFLPSADIDFALFFFPWPCKPSDIMQILINELEDLSIDGFTQLPQAKVPVLKFKTMPGISIDISFDELQGPLNVFAVRNIFETMPYLLPAQVFLKSVLHTYDLDKPFKGGISSYTLQLMLVAYVQYSGIPNSVTELIAGFCNFFGNDFNFTLTGIDVTGGGSFFSRHQTKKLSLETPCAMHIIDPFNPNNILGLNAFRMNDIRELLRDVHLKIINGKWKEILDSLQNELIENKSMHATMEKYAKKNNLL